MSAGYLGMEIGGSKLQIFLGDDHAHVVNRYRYPVIASKGASGIREQIQAAFSEILGTARVSALGVGFGGPIHYHSGTVNQSHQIEGWSNFPLREWLTALTGLPVAVDNDANVAALAEARSGAGRGLDPVFYITLGSGVGGGLVVNGRIYHGADPGEAEIGHVRLDRSGTTLESACSGWAVDQNIRQSIRAYPNGILAREVKGTSGAEAQFLARAAQLGDPEALRLLNDTAVNLACGLSHVIHLLHPQVVILGGGLSLVGELLRKAVESSLSQFVMEDFRQTYQVALAELREDAVPVGALHLARMQIP